MPTIEEAKKALLNKSTNPAEYQKICSEIGIYNFGRKAGYDCDSYKRFMESTSIAELQRWDRIEYDADAFFDRLCMSDCLDAWGRCK